MIKNTNIIRKVIITLLLLTISGIVISATTVTATSLSGEETEVLIDAELVSDENSTIKNVKIDSAERVSSQTIQESEWQWLPRPDQRNSSTSAEGELTPADGTASVDPDVPTAVSPDIGFRPNDSQINMSEGDADGAYAVQSAYGTVTGVLPNPTSGDSRYEITSDPSDPRTLKTVRLSIKINVSDQYPFAGAGFCTGTMITQKHVLTAAHCVHQDRGYSPKNTEIIAEPGAYYSSSTVVRPRHFANVEEADIHPDYNPNTIVPVNRYNNDIAVLTLDRPIGNKTGTWSYLADPPEENYDLSDTYVTGYPNRTATNNQIQHLKNKRLIEASGRGAGDHSFSSQRHAVKVDGSSGQSGGPVWARGYKLEGVSGAGYQEPVLISVFTGGSSQPYPLRGSNIGTKITADEHQFIKNSIRNTNQVIFKPDLLEGSHYNYWNDNTVIGGKSGGEDIEITRGDDLSLQHSIHNVGTKSAKNVEIDYYLSKNKKFEKTDVRIKSTTIKNIQPFSRGVINKNIPLDKDSGDYYLLRVIDPSDKIDEYSDDTSMNTHVYVDNSDDGTADATKITIKKASAPPGAVYNNPNATPAKYDDNNDGKIAQGELVDGLQDYSNNDIDQGELVDLLRAYSDS